MSDAIVGAQKLGKKAPKVDARTLKFAKYLSDTLPPAPASVDWSAKCAPNLGQMLNDSLGDCTCAALGHLVQVWTANVGTEVTLPDSDILAAYEAVGGYNPADPSTDGGAVELDVLNYAKATGVGGHVIDAYVAIEPDGQHAHHIRHAVWMFGGVYTGFALPVTAQGQDIWDVVADGGPDSSPGSWGGHAVPIIGYDATYAYIITWGSVKKVTWAFVAKYMDEAYALLSPDWVSTNAPSGFDLSQLQTDLSLL